MLRTWQAPGGSEELALVLGEVSGHRLLVLPAWFDEGNKTRHFAVECMRALEAAGIGSVLPDLPGCNESPARLEQQDLARWRAAAAAAAEHFECTGLLAIRAGANIAPALPGFAYAPLAGKSALRALLRARIIASREAGVEEKREDLLELGMAEGLELAGYRLGPAMIADLAATDVPAREDVQEIAQGDIGGAGLWLRMEPDHDPAQASSLARLIAAELKP